MRGTGFLERAVFPSPWRKMRRRQPGRKKPLRKKALYESLDLKTRRNTLRAARHLRKLEHNLQRQLKNARFSSTRDLSELPIDLRVVRR